MPRPFATQRGEDRRFLGGPSFEQFPDFGPQIAPLLPEAPAQAASPPGSEVRPRAVVLREPKVRQPAPDRLLEPTGAVGYRDAPASPRELTQLVAKVWEGRGGPREARAVESKAQDRALMGDSHRARGLVALQLQGPLEEPSPTGFAAVPGPPAGDDDQKVVTLPGKPRAASFQFLIQFLYHEVRQPR